MSLEYRLSWLKKNEAMQRSGFQLELIIFKFKEKEENMNEIEKKDFYNEYGKLIWKNRIIKKFIYIIPKLKVVIYLERSYKK